MEKDKPEELLDLNFDEEKTDLKPVKAQEKSSAKEKTSLPIATEIFNPTLLQKELESKKAELSVLEASLEESNVESIPGTYQKSLKNINSFEKKESALLIKVIKIILFCLIILCLFIYSIYKGTPLILDFLIKNGILQSDNKLIREFVEKNFNKKNPYFQIFPDNKGMISIIESGFIRTFEDKNLLYLSGEILLKASVKKVFVTLYDDLGESQAVQEITIGKIFTPGGFRYIKSEKDLEKMFDKKKPKNFETEQFIPFFAIFFDLPLKKYNPKFAISE